MAVGGTASGGPAPPTEAHAVPTPPPEARCHLFVTTTLPSEASQMALKRTWTACDCCGCGERIDTLTSKGRALNPVRSQLPP